MKDTFCFWGYFLVIFVIALAVIGIGALITGAIFMGLWNWLAVELFAATPLTYWKCVGICYAIQFIVWLLTPGSIKVNRE